MAHETVIVYGLSDKPVADAVCAILESRGIRCWIAPRDVPVDCAWGAARNVAIRAAHVVVMILTSQQAQSPLSGPELQDLSLAGVVLLPLRLEAVELNVLNGADDPMHWLDVLTPELARHAERLAETVKLLIARTEVGVASEPRTLPAKREPAGPLRVLAGIAERNEQDEPAEATIETRNPLQRHEPQVPEPAERTRSDEPPPDATGVLQSVIPINVSAEAGGKYRVTLPMVSKETRLNVGRRSARGPNLGLRPAWWRGVLALFATVAVGLTLWLCYPQIQRQIEHQRRNSLLVEAAAKGDGASVQRLIGLGADVNARDRAGNPALVAAADRGRTDAMRMLLDHGAAVDARDSGGTPAVTLAEMFGQSDAVKLLVERGANLNARDKDGMTVLMRAVFGGDTPAVQAILSKSPDLMMRDNHGNTAMRWASATGHDEIVALLTRAGAKP